MSAAAAGVATEDDAVDAGDQRRQRRKSVTHSERKANALAPFGTTPEKFVVPVQKLLR